MRSSSGEYFQKLDHVRAVACYTVFMWHVTHGLEKAGSPVPFDYTPSFFPLSILDEGHVGVSIFMCLSGYLFAKIINRNQINYPAFLWNRFIRLAPLLLLVIVVVGVNEIIFHGGSAYSYLKSIGKGMILPTLPNGGWSITVEVHFYLLLPLLLFLTRRSVWFALPLLAAAILIRVGIYAYLGEVQTFAYWTIIGRFDQFTLGIAAFYLSNYVNGRHWTAACVFLVFSLFYYAFDLAGGFFQLGGPYPSKNTLWIFMPDIEGVCISFLIAYYDATALFKPGRISRAIAAIGGVSYSIYLLHFFVVFHESKLIAKFELPYAGILACGTVAFLAMVPIGLASFHLIEKRFLVFRMRYKIASTARAAINEHLLA